MRLNNLVKAAVEKKQVALKEVQEVGDNPVKEDVWKFINMKREWLKGLH